MRDISWSHFEHKADMGIEGRGPSMEMAFAQAGLALNAIISDLKSISPRVVRQIRCLGDDPEILFFDFINEIIFLISSQGMIFCRIEVKITGSELAAWLSGEDIDPAKHDPAVEIKGASFNNLSVKQDKNGQWVARCVVDV